MIILDPGTLTGSFSFTLDFLKDFFGHIRSYVFQYKTDNSGLLKPSLNHAALLSKSISKKYEQEPGSDLVLRPVPRLHHLLEGCHAGCLPLGAAAAHHQGKLQGTHGPRVG